MTAGILLAVAVMIDALVPNPHRARWAAFGLAVVALILYASKGRWLP